jgi:hypothetical protein
MSDETTPRERELTQEELDRLEGEQLPDREVMSVIQPAGSPDPAVLLGKGVEPPPALD